MPARRGSASDRAYDMRRRMRAEVTRRGASSRGPARTLGKALILRQCDFIHRRPDFGPPLPHPNGLTHAIEKLVFAGVVASSGHWHRAQENARGAARRGRAISGRLRRVHAQAFVPTWRSRVATLVATWDRLVPNTRKQRQSRHISESLDII